LDDPRIEAVDLCVPNHLHRALAVRALEAGKHVLCEKPIALSLEDADAMLAAADRNGRFLMIGHVLRFWPEYVRASLLKDGVLVGAVGPVRAGAITGPPPAGGEPAYPLAGQNAQLICTWAS
jgi:UDP-N-acetylglucosamine 3-dehydrogenase